MNDFWSEKKIYELAKNLHKITHNSMTKRGPTLIGRSNKIGRSQPKGHSQII